jgi:CheY-like chemotaxis protein
VVKLGAIVVSHHQRFRRDLAQFVELVDPCIEVIGEVSSVQETMSQIEALRPGLVLLDLGLCRVSALKLTERIHAQWPATAVVVFGNELAIDYRYLALEAGAIGYVDVLEITAQLPAALQLAKHSEICGEVEIDEARSHGVGTLGFDLAAKFRARLRTSPTGPKHGPYTSWQYVHICLGLVLAVVILTVQPKADLELQRYLLLVLALVGIIIVEARQFARACRLVDSRWQVGVLKGGAIAKT